MASYLDIILQKLLTSENVREQREGLEIVAANAALVENEVEARAAPAEEGIHGFYSRMFDDLEPNDYGSAAVTADLAALDIIMKKPAKEALAELSQWWAGRVTQIVRDLSATPAGSDKTYLQQIADIIRVGAAEPEIFLPAVAELFADSYLSHLNPLIAAQIQPRDAVGLVSLLSPGIRPEDAVQFASTWAGKISQFLLGETKRTVKAEKKIEADLRTFEQDLDKGEELTNAQAQSELDDLLVFCTDAVVEELNTPKELAAAISDYLYSENEKGHFKIQSLMDAFGIGGTSDKYDIYQSKCVDIVSKFVFKLVSRDTTEKKRDAALATETKAQARVSKQELTQLVRVVNDFNSRLHMANAPAADVTEFNKRVKSEAQVFYGGEGRRVSRAEKVELKDKLIEVASAAASKVDGNKLTLRGTIQRFIDRLSDWVSSKFSAKAENKAVLKSSSPSSTDSRISGDTNASTKSQASVHVETGVKRLGEQLEKEIAPPPSKTPRPSSPGR